MALAFVVIVLAAIPLFAQASGSEPPANCRYGAISAIGPVDAQGRGQTVPDVRCLEP